jgi:hypothetical protein
MRRRSFGRWHDFDGLNAAAIGIFPNLLHDDAFQLVCRFQLHFIHGVCLIDGKKADSSRLSHWLILVLLGGLGS